MANPNMIPSTLKIPETEEKVKKTKTKTKTKHAQTKIIWLNLAPFHKGQGARYRWNQKEARA